jgi:hypothetical protein
MAVDAWELRTARLEGAYEQVERRLGTVAGRLAALERKVDLGLAELRGEIKAMTIELISKMDRQFYWLLGVLVVSILLPLG